MAQEEDERARQLLEALPAAIYTTDAGGRITFYNRAAAALWGRYPPASSRWCGSWRLYWPDGRPMPHDQCSMAVAIKQDRAVRSTEAIAERPDGTWFAFAPFPTPLHDTAGRVIGAVNMLVDITAHKNAEQHLHLLMLELDHRTKNMLAVLQGVIRCTKAETTREFAAEGRIMALARAHSLFSQHGWQGVDMRRLLEDGLTV